MEIVILIIMCCVIFFQFYVVKSMEDIKERIEAKTVEKPHEVKLTDEQRKKQEELRKNFENLMGYGYDQALRGDNKAD